MRQLQLIPKKKYRGRKIARAIATRRGENHIVLKSKLPLLRQHRAIVLRSIRDTQDRFHIRLRALAVMENHIHLVARVNSREQFANALRMLTGTIARRISKRGRFWLARAWSRVVTPGRDLSIASLYVVRNPMKAGLDSLFDSFVLLDGVLQL